MFQALDDYGTYCLGYYIFFFLKAGYYIRQKFNKDGGRRLQSRKLDSLACSRILYLCSLCALFYISCFGMVQRGQVLCRVLLLNTTSSTISIREQQPF